MGRGRFRRIHHSYLHFSALIFGIFWPSKSSTTGTKRLAIPPTINNLSHPFFRGRLVCASITGRIAAFAFGPPTLMDLGGSYWLTIIRHWHCLSGVCATTVAGIANSPMALITSILSTRMGLRWSLPTLIFNPIHNISAAQPQRHC